MAKDNVTTNDVSIDKHAIMHVIEKRTNYNEDYREEVAQTNTDPLRGSRCDRMFMPSISKYRNQPVFNPKAWDSCAVIFGMIASMDPKYNTIGVRPDCSWMIEVYSSSAEVPSDIDADIVIITKPFVKVHEVKAKVLIINNTVFFADKVTVTEHLCINTANCHIHHIEGKQGEMFIDNLTIDKYCKFENMQIHVPTYTTVAMEDWMIGTIHPTIWDGKLAQRFRYADFAWRLIAKLLHKQLRYIASEELAKDMEVEKLEGKFWPHGVINTPAEWKLPSVTIPPEFMTFTSRTTVQSEPTMYDQSMMVQQSMTASLKEHFDPEKLKDEFDRNKLIEILRSTGLDDSQIGVDTGSRKQFATMIYEAICNGSQKAVETINRFRAAKQQQMSSQQQSQQQVPPTAPDHNIVINQGRATDENYGFSPDGADQQISSGVSNPNNGGLFTGA